MINEIDSVVVVACNSNSKAIGCACGGSANASLLQFSHSVSCQRASQRFSLFPLKYETQLAFIFSHFALAVAVGCLFACLEMPRNARVHFSALYFFLHSWRNLFGLKFKFIFVSVSLLHFFKAVEVAKRLAHFSLRNRFLVRRAF